MITVRVQAEAFDLGEETRVLSEGRTDIGAVASFVGLVRGGEVEAMTLEHYPAMTGKALEAIAAEAAERWSILGGTLIHRHGRLLPGDPIVLVAITAAHRGDAFAACAFIMDYLKTGAPFWKKEETGGESRWVEAKNEDAAARDRWN
ncbi:molybdenum cofactor biosynthesis protein MoaE [Sphingosinicella microcystinivorans]|uniref:Molybdopterin synthase catalytic subunit n=1 Tax=Sphingosinicella microcystinivorans TaxID=335406 RepID=A0AAD1D895_SPHMI|nr:molybdenum cofactor biosynthesis protein MoaE [Sphingosinicella microcystinivorans]RKS92156.1 molybdopterin synthase subunit MoaE [Sphingosinicella microcystinivorans]BBE35178.1 Molybdopterin synthase catalytic subunit [Sphingosinicella microcystinivorans]